MIAGLINEWLRTGRLDLPLPAAGHTGDRWRRLAELAEVDLCAARLAEAHVDAAAILHELGGKPIDYDQLWGVWAAETPGIALTATPISDGRYVLNGTKPWCSGAGICSHALATAQLSDDRRGLFVVEVVSPWVRPLKGQWANPGMARCDTRSVQFNRAPATIVGGAGEYLTRPGFWYGAIGVAACWLGGARAVSNPLYERAAIGKADSHGLAHLGVIDAALTAAEATLSEAAAAIDRDPFDRAGIAELVARRCRATVEYAADQAITRTGRALGPAPLCNDNRHAEFVADLTVYLRQSHAERDLETLGRLAAQPQ